MSTPAPGATAAITEAELVAQRPSARLGWRESKTARGRIGTGLVFLLLVGLSVLFIAPVVWMFVTALKPNVDVFDGRWIPTTIHWQNFSNGWKGLTEDCFTTVGAYCTETPFGLYARNTLIVSLVSVAGSVISSSLVAYSFARIRWPGRDVLFILVLATMLIPSLLLFVPQYVLWSKLGYVDTWVPLTVPAWFGAPFYIFLLRQFFRGIPNDLTDASRVDGAGELKIWWNIVMPLARPALAAVAIFAFTGAWEDFFNPLLYLKTQSKYTLQLGLQVFEASAGGVPQYNDLMAVSFIIIVPVVVLFFLGQRYFIEGVTLTGLKG